MIVPRERSSDIDAARDLLDTASSLAIVNEEGTLGRRSWPTILGAADALGETIASLVADPAAYFLRFGFAAGDAHDVAAPAPEREPLDAIQLAVTQRCTAATTIWRRYDRWRI